MQQSSKTSERSIGRSTPPETPITLTPLDQLLEFPFDEHEVVSRVPKDSPEVAAYKNRVKHLTELLADAERDIEKLTQLNQLLKEDIRRQKRYVEREKEAVNFEYLKNIVFKVFEGNLIKSLLLGLDDYLFFHSSFVLWKIKTSVGG